MVRCRFASPLRIVGLELDLNACSHFPCLDSYKQTFRWGENYRSSPASCPSNKPISLWCLFAQIWPYHSHPFLNRRPVCPSPRPLALCSEEQMALTLAQGNAADAQGTSINTLTYTEIESYKERKAKKKRENYLKASNSDVFHLGIHNSF